MNENSKHRSSFRQIMKGTAIFGGTQFVSLLVNIVRGKCVASILGSFGMGISAMLTSTLQPIVQFFSLGIPMSAVSRIANSASEDEMSQRVTAMRRCMLILAFMASLYVLSTSAVLSGMASGNGQDGLPRMWFAALGIVAFFTILSQSENAILQGNRAIGRLARANVLAPVLGLVVGVPIYYVWGVDGIVPAMLLMSFLTWAYTRWCARDFGSGTISQSWYTTCRYSRDMITLGLTLMISGLLGNLVVYLINIFIYNHGGAGDVGFYQSANSITLQCTAMVFAALSTDFYPSLAQRVHDMVRMHRLINHEMEIVVLVIAPIVVMLMMCAPYVVRILLTEEFLKVVPVVQMMSLVFLMRAYFFPLDFICLARNDKTYYFCVEGLWTNIKSLAFFVAGYWLSGLMGLGYAAIANGLVDILVSTVLVWWRYGFRYELRTMRLFLVMFVPASVILILVLSADGQDVMRTTPAWALSMLVTVCSVVLLNKRVGLCDLIREKFRGRDASDASA